MEIALVIRIPVYRTIVIVGQVSNVLKEQTALEELIAASLGFVNVEMMMNARGQNFASLVNVEVCDYNHQNISNIVKFYLTYTGDCYVMLYPSL